MRNFVLLVIIVSINTSLYSQYLITDPDSLQNNGADYLIITHQDFTNKMEPLCKLRDSLGLEVKMAEAPLIYSTFQGASRADRIKAFTQQVYDNWDTRPEYILLVGDANYGDSTEDYIPSKLFPKFSYSYLGGYTTHASDNWYVQLDGDNYQPDIAIGRLTIGTAQACESLVDKIITYERNTDTAGIWRRTVCVVASRDYERYATPLLDTFFIPAGDSIVRVFDSDGPNSTALRNRTINAFNQGIVFLFMMAHGSTTPIWTGDYTLFHYSDIDNLTNDAVFPVVFGRG